MKNSTVIISLLACFMLITSCSDVYNFSIEHKKQTTLNTTIKVTVKEKENKTINSVQFFVDGKEISSKSVSVDLKTSDYGVGKHQISALIFYPEKTKK